MTESEDIVRLRNGFDSYYNNVLLPQLAQVEIERKKYLRYFILGLIIVFVILPLFCGGLFLLFLHHHGGTFHFEGEMPVNAIFFILLILIIVISSPLYFFKRKSKSNIMPHLLKYFGDFSYKYEQRIDDDILEKSCLFGSYNRHYGDDFFSGTYQNVQITVSEEELLFHTNHGKRSCTTTVFDGIVIMLSMNKNFSGKTVVFKDRGIFNACYGLGSGLQKISLEDSVFEKEFEVYGSDQLEARYLLTTAFMERMLKVRNVFKGKQIQFSFFDNRLLIAINTRKNMFESTSIFRSATDRTLVDETFEQITSVIAVADILKLNTRLGL